ncbi:hypothetical protein [Novipirellula rosea]|uniref:Uncharacterized protein n=1 Tax=Novipirellula rosea TaxID=1031540 RepID=A0ABP8NGE5_9BACT
MANLKVSPGDDITAALHNQIVDRLPSSKAGKPAIVGGMSHNWVPVQNDSEDDFEEADVVAVLDYQGPTDKIYDTQQAVEFLIEEPDPSETQTLGVCLAPIAAGQPGYVVIIGVAHVNLVVTNVAHQYAIPDPSSPRRLTSSPYGPARIIDTVNSSRGIVVFGVDVPVLVRFAMTSGWTSGAATATIKTMTGDTIRTGSIEDPEGIFTELSSGDKGLAVMQGGKYYITQAHCGS